MSTFAHAFREIVVPQLQPRIRYAALMLELGDWSFGEAHQHVWELARRRGAVHLDDDFLLKLSDWLDKELLNAAIEVEAVIRVAEETAARVARDIARCEAKWTMT